MIATLPALTPTAAQPPATQAAATEDPTFLALLDEKQSAQPEAACSALSPAVPFNAAAQMAEQTGKKEKTDDDADAAQALLALMNLTPAAAPEAAEARKAPLPPSMERDRDAAPSDAQGSEPLPTTATPLSWPQTADAPTVNAPETGLSAQGVAATAAGDDGPDILSRPTASTRKVSVAPPEPKPRASAPAEPQAVALKADALSLASSAGPTKARRAPQSESAFSLTPPAPLTTSTPARAVSNARVQETAVLTEPMGTPAWQQSLGQQLACFTRNGVQHAELRLHPAELGSLQIRLQLKNEQAQLHFVSESHQVRAAIEAAVPHLRVSLAEAGIELGQSSIGAETSSSWQHPDDAPQPQPRQPIQAERASVEERLDISTPARVYRRGINTFA